MVEDRPGAVTARFLWEIGAEKLARAAAFPDHPEGWSAAHPEGRAPAG